MKKQIAVFMCSISFDNQRRILEGILEGAKENDINVFVFTCHLNVLESNANKQGAYNIMSLPDLKEFSGAIVLKNTIQLNEAGEKLISRIKESGIPAVSVDEEIEGMDYVGISCYQAQRQLIEHLVKAHGITRINYVSGITANKEGMDRYRAYKDVMIKYGEFHEEHQVYFGHYDMDSGSNAVKQFIKICKKIGESMPQAICCANDAMAIGVMEELMRQGYRVPEDIAVTGFDNDELSSLYFPALTTIERNQEIVGKSAVEILLTGEKKDKCTHRMVNADMVIRDSCGCHNRQGFSLEKIRKKFVDNSIIVRQATDGVKNMAIDLANIETLKEMYDILKHYIRQSDLEEFYLCMCEKKKIFPLDFLKDGAAHMDCTEDVFAINSSYTDNVSIPLAYKNGVFSEYGSFAHGKVLPDEYKDDKVPAFYIVAPVYCKNWCFGYCISKNSYFALKSEMFYSWIINIGVSLENIRKRHLLEEMVNFLNGMWAYDMLTKIYNRAGFFYNVRERLKQIQRASKKAFLIFVDLDGLKHINDTLGHEWGDRYIVAMADILREKTGDNELIMRYGGDEYAVFGECLDDTYVTKLVGSIHEEMNARFIECDGSRYHIEASMGVYTDEAANIKSLEQLLENADKKMYQEKHEKKNGGRR